MIIARLRQSTILLRTLHTGTPECSDSNLHVKSKSIGIRMYNVMTMFVVLHRYVILILGANVCMHDHW